MKTFQENCQKFLSKADIKTNLNFLSIFPCLGQLIIWYASKILSFVVKMEKKNETVLKIFFADKETKFSLHELKMSSNLPTMTKRAKRKTTIKNKFVILRLRLFENHAVVAKIISLFVEKIDFFL